jgi:hypothetical protein
MACVLVTLLVARRRKIPHSLVLSREFWATKSELQAEAKQQNSNDGHTPQRIQNARIEVHNNTAKVTTFAF